MRITKWEVTICNYHFLESRDVYVLTTFASPANGARYSANHVWCCFNSKYN